jgi:hypothetical protein
MPTTEIVDVIDGDRFGLIPPCADPSFDHRSCDYWEDADRGLKTKRPSWFPAAASALPVSTSADRSAAEPPGNPFEPAPRRPSNPFAPPPKPANPFAPPASRPVRNPFLDEEEDSAPENPFVPQRPARPAVPADSPRKLQLLGRGLGIFGSYAKVLLVDGEAAAYCQFGPLSAYPRALRTRELYPHLPDAPLPAIITCIATTAAARKSGHALRLVAEVCRDLAARGFAAVEAFPEARAVADATPAARPEFWIRAGFVLAVDDERFPVMRRAL